MNDYPEFAARLNIDYPEKLDRFTSFFRVLWIIPIAIILGLISGAGQTVNNTVFYNEAGEILKRTQETAGGLVSGLAVATGLLIIFSQVYPRWWFDFSRELARFGARVGAYMCLLTDHYPSTIDEQSVHLEIDYPDVKKDLNRWLPLVKWLLAFPHYIATGISRRWSILRSDFCLVWNSVHRSLSKRLIRLRRRSWPLGFTGKCLRLPSGN